jgi:hypothetical protein
MRQNMNYCTYKRGRPMLSLVSLIDFYISIWNLGVSSMFSCGASEWGHRSDARSILNTFFSKILTRFSIQKYA